MTGVPPIVMPLYYLGACTSVCSGLSLVLSFVQIARRKTLPAHKGPVLWLSIVLALAGGALAFALHRWTVRVQSSNPYEEAAWELSQPSYLDYPWPALLLLLLAPGLRRPWPAIFIVLTANMYTLHELFAPSQL